MNNANGKTKGRAGRWRFLHESWGKRVYWVRDIGHVSVMRIEPGTTNNPSPRPWHLVNWGTTHDTPEAALDHAIESYFNPPETRDDRTYERAEALMCGLGQFEQA